MKIQHILKKEDFTEILLKGRKIHGEIVVVYISPREDLRRKTVSVGVIISKRLASLAVKRNHLRRVIYAYFRGHESPSLKGRKIVVRLKSNVNKYGKKELSGRVREELRKLTRITA